MLDWLAQNWQYILFTVLAVGGIAYGIMTRKCLEWLKIAVARAEEELGTGTGQLKLRQVYDWFLAKFPKFSVIVPFPIFSQWVDLALKWLRLQLENNKNIKDVIVG